jgi:pimeloyl-ACP methyl ester carboxylesterase
MPLASPRSTRAPRATASGSRALSRRRGRLWSAFGVVLATIGCAPPGPQVAQSAVEPMRHRVTLGAPLKLELSYLQSGDNRGVRLILIHGTPGSASGWADYLAEPPPGVEVVAIDRPGFGDSGPEGAVVSLAEQAAAVTALFPADGRPVLLLGHSLGGPIAAWVAATHPERVAGLVLLAASLDPTQEAIHPMQYVGAWTPVRGLLPRAIRNANAELMALKPELLALEPLLPRIVTKVVIVHGTQDDLVPLANVPYMQARLTGARCLKTVLLDGRNHFLPWNSADTVRAAIASALEPAC